MAYTTTAKLKTHLNIETAFTDDDTYLTDIIAVVEMSIKSYCNGGLDEFSDQTMPVVVKHCALLLAAHLYLNRTMVSFAQGYEIPYSYKFLLNPYRIYTVG
jgi:hypothetical protein